MSDFYIPIDNQLSFREIPRNNTLKLDIKNHCNAPMRTLVIDWKGNCFICACEAWLPISIGNIVDFDSLDQVWNNQSAKKLQEDVESKKFTYCAVDRCGIVNANINYPTYYISVNIDESCNLRCPSCRKETIMYHPGDKAYQTKKNMVDKFISILEKFDEPCHIAMSGNGDPLASGIMRPLIHQYQPRHNHTIRLFTNGLLLKKQLPGSTILNNITQYFISIDAGSQDVYESVRLGGRFDNLLENFDYLRSIVDKSGAEVLLKFVLQKNNWWDMENFVKLCIKYNFQGVINRLENWGTWENFQEEDVIGNSNHPDYVQAIDELKRTYTAWNHRIQFNASLIEIARS